MLFYIYSKPHSISELDQKHLDRLKAKFWPRVDKTGNCWIWIGHKYHKGYGCVTSTSKQRRRINLSAHRVSYELLVGEIPEGLTLDHLCRNHACVNPDHLEPVSLWVNQLRGIATPALNAEKTFCKNGHPLTPENLTKRVNVRECSICKKEAWTRWKLKNPEYQREWLVKHPGYMSQWRQDHKILVSV